MTVSSSAPAWLLLVFSLPASRASQRVEVWRKLQRCGALALGSAGHVLPNTADNREKFEWLAGAIRNYQGQASVVQAHSFDNLPAARLQRLFVEARSRDYAALLRELTKLLNLAPLRRPAGRLSRLRRRFQEITMIDFFQSPARKRVDTLLVQADERQAKSSGRSRARSREYHHREWVTRHRPGIDRVSSAWLIRRFIDAKARFVFADRPDEHPQAVPFDMFTPEGFGHRGQDCTFETLVKHFAVRDPRVKPIAQIIHDADLGDEKFGRREGEGLDRVLKGWAKQEISDDELLLRGMELIEGLYWALSEKA